MNPEDITARATASTVHDPAERETGADSGPAPRPSSTIPRGTPFGRFIVIETLGSGAMGEVVLAYDPDLHRRVAVKVLKPHLASQGGGAAVQRMLREARAMAQVSHPNVITVFEVAQTDAGQNFIAMEFVDGGTLRDWAAQTRSWREVARVYSAAGAGLAAAHAKGLVHRDFKPDNVLIGGDGRVYVTDFGLVGAQRDEGTSDQHMASHSDELRLTEATLTQSGSLLGTPAYMPPEQGRAQDPRSDQFSFCVALYEALYGERPFAGSTLAELRANVHDDSRRPIPRDKDVPRWLREVVERGLSHDPLDRWPDMHALLQALKRDPSRRHRQLAYGTAGLVVVGGALAFGMQRDDAAEPTCDAGVDETESIWNQARSDQLRRAFIRVDADADVASFEAAMEEFVDAWQSGHRDACEAHHVRAEQSGAMFDRRMLCLRRRLERADALLSAFEDPDDAAVAAAGRIQGTLPSVDTCADIEALQSMVPPPDATDVRREWKQLQLGIDRADGLGVAGRHEPALEAYAELREPIEALDHPPLTARYLQNYGNALVRIGKFDEAIDVLALAPAAAARSDDARLEANVWLLLARAHGFGLGDAKAGAWAVRAAEVAAVRADDQPMMQLNIQYTQAILADQAGDYARGLVAARAAVKASEEVYGHAHRNTSAAYGTLGNALHHVGELDDAQQAHETSLEIDRGLHPEGHADIGHSLVNLGLLDGERGDHETERKRYEEALEIYRQTVGEQSESYGTALLNLAANAANREAFAEARDRFEEVLAFYEATRPQGHEDFGIVYVNLAEVARGEGDLDDALTHARRALTTREAALGSDHPKVMLARITLGRIHLARGEHEQAESQLRAAQAIAEVKLGPDHPDHVDILVPLGEVLTATDRAEEARPLLERAVQLAGDAPPQMRARAEAALAAIE